MNKIGERLEMIARYAEGSKTLADIGTDHAYLPIFLSNKGFMRKIILTDINEGPLIKAKRNLEKHASPKQLETQSPKQEGNHNTNQIANNTDYYSVENDCNFSCRIGDGLEPISLGEVDVAVIAGMGGELIAKILSHDIQKTESIGYYILQPRSKCEDLRYWIRDNGYAISAEDLVKERGKICEIIAFSPSSGSRKITGNQIIQNHNNDSCDSGNLRDDQKSKIQIIDYIQLDYLKGKNNSLLEEYLLGKIKTEKNILTNTSKSKTSAEDKKLEAQIRCETAKKRIEGYSKYLKEL